MAIEVPGRLIEGLLLGRSGQRHLQDSPILGDVWVAFAQRPDQALELLITPDKTSTASTVALVLEDGIDRPPQDDPHIAFLQGIVAARLYFAEVLKIVVPITEWWQRPS